MSAGSHVRKRSGIWSYLSFSSSTPSSTTRNRRTLSGSHPQNGAATTSSSYPSSNSSGNLASFSSPSDYFKSYRSYPRSPATAYSGATDKDDSWMAGRRRLRLLRVAGLIGIVVFVLYFLTPSSERQRVESYMQEHAPFKPSSEPKGEVALDPTTGTSKCNRSYKPGKPLVQYVLMIDAGSTGSRIHVYRFNNCGPTPELEDEVFEMTPKKEGGSGLSSYGADAEGAAESLDILMDVAMKSVPDRLKGCTPVAVKATAGLRKLGPELSDKILKAVRNRLETKYPFPVVSEAKGGVEVMDGKYEGVYAWITTNYLLGKIGGPDSGTPTAAVFDLGGGSTQIVFEPNYRNQRGAGMPQKLADGDHKYELDFGGRQFSLYQHSYLGYGLMAARSNIHTHVLEAAWKDYQASSAGVSSLEWLTTEGVVNPCIVPGMNRTVEVEMPDGHALGKKVTVKMIGPSSASAATLGSVASQCHAVAERTLRKDAECKLHPCAFDGVHQPSLEKTFVHEDIFLFSYFYDRIKPLGLPESFTLRELKELTHRVCAGPDGEGKPWAVFSSIEGAMDELRGRPESCLDLSFMFSLLHLGYEMPIDREVKIAKKIKGNELGWCLGASLPLLDSSSGWECKIKEV